MILHSYYRYGKTYFFNKLYVIKKGENSYIHYTSDPNSSNPIEIFESGGLYFLSIDDLIEFEEHGTTSKTNVLNFSN